MTLVRAGAATLLLVLGAASAAAAQQTIFVVRHAERADSAPAAGQAMTAPATDPPLSAAGNERAARLATILRSADIRHIFSTEFARTRQTVGPIAKALNLEIITAPARDVEALIGRVRDAKGNVLIAGHSNTVPEILKRLGFKDEITIAESEYDNLFVVTRPATGEPTLVRLRF
jgi:phosphohistidine phosphatase SixA